MKRGEKPLRLTEPTVTISKREYDSLRACAELLRHPDIIEFTLKNLGEPGEIPIEEALKKSA